MKDAVGPGARTAWTAGGHRVAGHIAVSVTGPTGFQTQRVMVLPSLIVGNELLILGGVAVAVGGWFLAHRHGQLRGAVEMSRQDSGTARSESA